MGSIKLESMKKEVFELNQKFHKRLLLNKVFFEQMEIVLIAGGSLGKMGVFSNLILIYHLLIILLGRILQVLLLRATGKVKKVAPGKKKWFLMIYF